VKFAWNKFPPAVVIVTTELVVSKSIVAVTDPRLVLSVIFAVMVTVSVWLNKVSVAGSVIVTFGVFVSFPIMNTNSVSLTLPRVSLAIINTVYDPFFSGMV